MYAMKIVVGRVGLSVDREERGTHSPSLLSLLSSSEIENCRWGNLDFTSCSCRPSVKINTQF
jgi:hypothetical protein